MCINRPKSAVLQRRHAIMFRSCGGSPKKTTMLGVMCSGCNARHRVKGWQVPRSLGWRHQSEAAIHPEPCQPLTCGLPTLRWLHSQERRSKGRPASGSTLEAGRRWRRHRHHPDPHRRPRQAGPPCWTPRYHPPAETITQGVRGLELPTLS